MEAVTIARWSQHTGRPLQSSGVLSSTQPRAPVSQYVKVIAGLHINSQDLHSVGHHHQKKKQPVWCGQNLWEGSPGGACERVGVCWGCRCWRRFLKSWDDLQSTQVLPFPFDPLRT
jgi:hypothetical protein